MSDRDTERPALLKSENTEEIWHKRQELSVPVAYASEIRNVPLCEPQIQEYFLSRNSGKIWK